MHSATDLDRVRDPERLALAWWGQSLARTCRIAGLSPVHAGRGLPDVLASMPGAQSGHVVAVTPSLLLDGLEDGPPLVVVGGPCIGDCGPFATLEALFDAVQPILVARALRVGALVYLGDREEMLGAGGEGRWRAVAERMERWILRLAEVLDWPHVTISCTSRPAHETALALAGAPSRRVDGSPSRRVDGSPSRRVDPALLDAAFHLGSGMPRVQDESARHVTSRVVEAHLPVVVQRHLGLRATPTVLVAENLQQAAACTLAASLASAAGQRLEMIAHLPAPGASAGQRMYRSEPWDKLAARELVDVASGARADVHPLTRQFFACWLDASTRRALADASEPA